MAPRDGQENSRSFLFDAKRKGLTVRSTVGPLL